MEGEEEGMAGSYLVLFDVGVGVERWLREEERVEGSCLVLFDVGGGVEVRWWRGGGGGDGGILPGSFLCRGRCGGEMVKEEE